MTLTPSIVAAWVAQSTGLALLGLALLLFVPVAMPVVRLRWCQALLVASLVLPWMLPAIMQTAVPGTAVGESLWLLEATAPAMQSVSPSAPWLSPSAWVVLLWSAGSVARGIWLGAGMWRLYTLRRTSASVEDRALQEARHHVPVAVQCRRSLRISRPLTFGLRHPVVLVPDALLALPSAQRQAVWVHELLHVARGDIRAAFAEEVLRIVLWWHPAVWLITAQLRLAREQVVDAAAVALTHARRPYLEVLLWYASGDRERLPLQAPAFFTRHQLLTRVRSLTTEVHMSRTRLLATVAGLAIMFSVGSIALAAVTPLPQATAHVDADGPGVLERIARVPTLDIPAPRRTLPVDPQWPPEAQAAGLAARYRLHVVVTGDGTVAEARVVQQAGGATRPSAEGGAAPRQGDGIAAHAAMRRSAVEAARQWQFDVPLEAPMLLIADVTVGPLDEWAARFQTTLRDRTSPQPTSTDAAAQTEPGPTPPHKIVDVQPIYPAIAKAASVSGVVIVDFAIEPTGEVSDLRVLRSIPLLDATALEAVRQWKYAPVDRPTRMAATLFFAPRD